MTCSKCDKPARNFGMPYDVVDLETGEKHREQVLSRPLGISRICDIVGEWNWPNRELPGPEQDLDRRLFDPLPKKLARAGGSE